MDRRKGNVWMEKRARCKKKRKKRERWKAAKRIIKEKKRFIEKRSKVNAWKKENRRGKGNAPIK